MRLKAITELPMLLAAGTLLLTASAPRVGARQAEPQNALRPGELRMDHPTLRCLSFRWPVSGDANGNAKAALAYRRRGEKEWRPALPPLRVQNERVDRDFKPFRCANLFAGSILDLRPGTAYAVRITLSDPDGGRAEKTVTMQTRREPPVFAGARQAHVYPDGYAGRRASPSFPDLQAAMRQARPGDVVLLHAGTYRGPFQVAVDGTEERPIVFRAAGDGTPILEGQDYKTHVIETAGKRGWLGFEGLTIRRGYTGIKANGCRSLLVRRCTIEDVHCGVITYTPDAADWYLADNAITGKVQNWYPRVESSDTGINVCGTGHVVAFNRVRKFWDCISTDNLGNVSPEWATQADAPQTAIDIIRNDCSEALDDGIEADYGLHNIRVLENRIFNVHTGISAQPNLGGPLYLVRNLIVNTTYTPFKMHNYSTGLLLLHNTGLSAKQAFETWPPHWQNATVRNNLFLGAGRHAMETGSPDPRVTLDYNGYGKTPGSDRFLAWSSDGGKTWGRYESVAAFHRATGQEAHGLSVGYADFVRAAPPTEGKTYPLSAFDLRLKPDSAALDAGAHLPTINEGFAGRAPDLGCYERGRPIPRYGPRPK